MDQKGGSNSPDLKSRLGKRGDNYNFCFLVERRPDIDSGFLQPRVNLAERVRDWGLVCGCNEDIHVASAEGRRKHEVELSECVLLIDLNRTQEMALATGIQ